MISRIIKVEADYTCRDLDYSGYHKMKTSSSYCFIIHCFMENIHKLLCEMQVDFYLCL